MSRRTKSFLVRLFNSGVLKSPGAAIVYYMGFKRHRLNEHIEIEDSIDKMVNALGRISDYCSSREIDFVTVVIPRPDGDPDRSRKEQNKTVFERCGLPFNYLADFPNFVADMKFPDDGHYTAAGNRMLAQNVVEALMAGSDRLRRLESP